MSFIIVAGNTFVTLKHFISFKLNTLVSYLTLNESFTLLHTLYTTVPLYPSTNTIYYYAILHYFTYYILVLCTILMKILYITTLYYPTTYTRYYYATLLYYSYTFLSHFYISMHP